MNPLLLLALAGGVTVAATKLFRRSAAPEAPQYPKKDEIWRLRFELVTEPPLAPLTADNTVKLVQSFIESLKKKGSIGSAGVGYDDTVVSPGVVETNVKFLRDGDESFPMSSQMGPMTMIIRGKKL